MRSQLFRTLIQSLLAASLPLTGSSGCDTCSETDLSAFSADTNLRVRLQFNTCQYYCGSGTCHVIIAGQSPMAIDCNGAPPVTSVESTFAYPILEEDCNQVCQTSDATSCQVSNQFYPTKGMNARLCYLSKTCVSSLRLTPIDGRRPAELVLPDCSAQDDVGAFFAAAAQLESASIDAFAILADELRHHGAPESLVASADRARQDEIRHTRMTAALAVRFSASAVMPTVARSQVRSLFAIALENVVEGCVREAYGAFLASWQAQAATDEAVRGVMARIAPDEVQHAELAFAVADWIKPQLSEPELRTLAAARAGAIEELLSSLADPISESLRTTAGLPPSEVSRSFVLSQARLLA